MAWVRGLSLHAERIVIGKMETIIEKMMTRIRWVALANRLLARTIGFGSSERVLLFVPARVEISQSAYHSIHESRVVQK